MTPAYIRSRARPVCLLAMLGLLAAALAGFGGAPQSGGATPATGAEPQTVGPVTNLSASVDGQPPGAVRLTWTAAENAQVYFIAYIKSADTTNGSFAARPQMAAFNGTEGVITDLEPGTPYSFIAVGARWNWPDSGAVWGQWSGWVTATPYNLDSAASDHAALVALYHATNGPNWYNNDNWLSDAPLGEWDGVTTDDNGRVTELDLRRNRLTGAIPAELGSLTNLVVLVLIENQLTGAIPAELGNLANLEGLALSENQLTGAIPAELGNLANLEVLVLSENQLTGAIPAELGSLANLEVLVLSENQLTGAIPAELGNLANLWALVLIENQLTGAIPAELGNLTNLRYLSLSGNQLTGCIPAALHSVANNDLDSLGLPFCE